MNRFAAISAWQDPYAVWADKNDFDEIIVADDRSVPGSVAQSPDSLVSYMVELNDANDYASLATSVANVHGSIAQLYKDSRIATMRLPRNAQNQWFGEQNAKLRRIELSAPIGATSRPPLAPTAENSSEPKSTAKVLFGVLDDACPLLKPDWEGRVLALWEQGRNRSAQIPGIATGFGVSSRFQYGWEYWKSSSAVGRLFTGRPTPLSISRWKAAQYVAPGGAIDESAAYRDWGASMLDHRLSHGAHVLDLLTGSLPPATRLTAITDAPDWKTGGDDAADADIVFVQFPKNAVRDTTGRWLGSHVIDGLRYVLSFAKPGQNVIVCTSYGYTTGSHDGSSLLEQALDQLCFYYDGSSQRPKLTLVLPTGNHRAAATTAVLALTSGESKSLNWRVLPDGNTSTFLELWFPDDFDPANVKLTIKPPIGNAFTVSGQGCYFDGNSQTTVILQQSPGAAISANKKCRVLIALSATEITQCIAGSRRSPFGDWIVEIQNTSHQEAIVNAYLSRSTPHLNFRRSATMSYFVSKDYDPDQYLRRREDDIHGGSIRRQGAMSGLCTGAYTKKVTGYRLVDQSHPTYASIGPNRAGFTSVTAALPTDFGRVLQGVLAGGNFGRVVSRLIGTSTAAPQYARLAANHHTVVPPTTSSRLVATPYPLYPPPG